MLQVWKKDENTKVFVDSETGEWVGHQGLKPNNLDGYILESEPHTTQTELDAERDFLSSRFSNQQKQNVYKALVDSGHSLQSALNASGYVP